MLEDVQQVEESSKNDNLEPRTTSLNGCFGETTISYIKIWNRPIETTICNWLFGVLASFWLGIFV